MARAMEFATLHNGAKMPLLGYGTSMVTGGTSVAECMETAFNAGYRHFDTAAFYQNEAEIGDVLKSWLSSGRVKREEFFIVTKLPPVGNRADSVETWITRSLQKLQLNYIDLYLIHKPFGLQERGQELVPTDESGNILADMETDHISLWKAMEAQVDAGRARAIGLSDFNERQIQRILDNCRIKPANLQTELHLIYQRKPLVDFCHRHGITVVAYSPLGSPGKADLYRVYIPNLMGHPLVVELAVKYKKSRGQILLKQIVQRGISAIPKSSNTQRIKENIDIFDFRITEEDMKRLDALDKGKDGKILILNHVMKGIENHPENNDRGMTGQKRE